MKKLFFIALLGLISFTCTAQVQRDGKTFTKVSTSKAKSDTLVTEFNWEVKDSVLPIIINKNSGACFVGKVSKKSGKYYRQYLPKEVSAEVAKELSIEYKTKEK